MAIRISTRSNYSRVLTSLRLNTGSLIRAQEQLASGRRVLRPSDDPSGTSRILNLERQLAGVGRFRNSAAAGTTLLETASSSLQDASSLMTEARALIVQSMNGTLTDSDRESLSREFGLLRTQMLELANGKQGDRYLFGGTDTGRAPFEETTINGRPRVMYRGNTEEQEIEIGEGSYLAINVAGSDIFDRFEPSGTRFVGSTGVQSGTTADQGRGYEQLRFRHDGTDIGLATGVGIALVNGGADDSQLGTQSLVIDGTARTIKLGDGALVRLPDAGSAELSDVVVQNAAGADVHLDLSGWTGVDYTGDVTGQGSVALGSGSYTSLDFSETNLALRDNANGTTLHIDTTNVTRSGDELVTFGGTASVFDVLAGIEADLLNPEGRNSSAITARISDRLTEFDRSHENLLVGLGVMGARAKRIQFADERSQGLELQIESLLSNTRDADFAEVALDLARAETTLQTAQAAGARLIQNSLLNFLR